jgi:micrococcal nuclease
VDTRHLLLVLVAGTVLLAGCAGGAPDASNTPSPTDSLESPNTSPTAANLSLSNSGLEEVTVTVTNVVDGDTIDIRFENGTTDTVRLLGVDTPEVNSDVAPGEYEGVPATTAGRDCLRDWGRQASEYATDRLQDETVTLVFDNMSDRRGSYGRLLAYVMVDNDNFNYAIVENGYARVFDSTFFFSDHFYDAEEQAQAAETGLWECRSDSTQERRTDLVVARVHANAAGNDHENRNDEYIVFQNVGDEELDLTGWSVTDEAGYTYYFPDSFILDSGERVTLYTGSGEDTDSELYWEHDSAVWNNGGDTVFVYNAAGDLVLEESYGPAAVLKGDQSSQRLPLTATCHITILSRSVAV